ncbi:MAG: creatininase family protein [Rhodospirillales bacterium]|nr:MAG: creatininase family protein [Rhodospirillales bacterium]
MRGHILEDLTWVEAKARIDSGAPIVIPIGAAAKAHGPHLPLRTDATTALALGRRVAGRLPVLVAPLVPFGHYPAFTRYPGSQSLSAATFIAVLRELCEGFAAQGARRIALINTGYSTEAPVNIALGEIRKATGLRVVCAHLRFIGRGADALLDAKEGGHADERETSVMLALDPRAVRMDRLSETVGAGDAGARGATLPPGFARSTVLSWTAGEGDPDEFAPSGTLGDATRATAYKGERVLEAITDDLVAGLRAAFPDAPGFGGQV